MERPLYFSGGVKSENRFVQNVTFYYDEVY
jgi:hypothetical protein